MNILIIGNGGREHAIIEKILNDKQDVKVFCAPGITAIDEKITNVNISATDIPALSDFVKKKSIDITIVGPEAPLVEGIVDHFNNNKLKIFGPSKKAALLEGSKAFSKAIMKKYNIPTASYETFTNIDDAKNYIEQVTEFPIVIKASGLAAGKGVVIPENKEDALSEINEIMGDQKFGSAGDEVVIESFLKGEEASVFAICDGKNFVCLSPAQDHKRIGEGDTGKNTGGMGAYAPAPVVSDDIMEIVKKQIIQPLLTGMDLEGSPYKGVLFVGLMINEKKVNVVEFNCRFGDPETQVVLPLLDESLLNLINESIEGKIQNRSLKFKKQSSITVVLASGGYPDKYTKNYEISGLNELTDVQLIHAGTKKVDAEIYTNGGRVLNIVGTADNLQSAAERVYKNIKKIQFENSYYRKDIGHKVL